MKQLTENFNLSEFVCQCGCGDEGIKDVLVYKLQKVREGLGSGMSINSGVRCETHNKKVGGSPTSSHIGGWAVDIKCTASSCRQKLLTELTKHFDRIGIAKSFIHVDVDENKSPAIWTY